MCRQFKCPNSEARYSCGISQKQWLDVVVNLLAAQAIVSGELVVLGGQQFRPNIHIEAMVAVYLVLINKPDLTGIFNAVFENLTVLQIAELISEKTGARINIEKLNDPRSYNLDSSKLLSAGFKPLKSVRHAVDEVTKKVSSADFEVTARNYNIRTMTEILGIGA